MTAASAQALSVLRSTENLQWYIIPLMVSVVYIYFVEIEKKNWSPVLLGLAFWATEFILGEYSTRCCYTLQITRPCGQRRVNHLLSSTRA